MTDRPGPAQNPGAYVRKEKVQASRRPSLYGRERPGLSREQLQAVRVRNPEALTLLFDRYFDRVYALVYRLMGERMAAEDVTQEVFIKVYRAAEQIDPERDPLPWLLTIAHNACRDVWRSNAYRLRRQSASLEENPALAAKLASLAPDPERELVTIERERRVQSALRQLPEPLRVAVVLHDFQKLGHEQIATMLEINYAAARKRYSRALAALVKLLKGMDA
jgi:RNA polymerase sigma-70 factor (ECF subfamily)